jgi:hypothetical protein
VDVFSEVRHEGFQQVESVGVKMMRERRKRPKLAQPAGLRRWKAGLHLCSYVRLSCEHQRRMVPTQDQSRRCCEAVAMLSFVNVCFRLSLMGKYLARGTHPKYVQHPAGHASIQLILDRYSHWIPSMCRHAAEGMDEVLG